MPRDLVTPSTIPVPSPPGALLLFIQRAQLAIYYDDRQPATNACDVKNVPGEGRELAVW